MKSVIPRREIPIHFTLLVLAILTFYPMVFMVITSLKTNNQFFHNFWSLSLPLHWENYLNAWEAIDGYILNSMIVSLISVLGVLTVSTLSAYAFARHKFPGSSVIFFAILSLMMIPGILTLISSFMWMKHFPFLGGNNWLGQGGRGLLNTHFALIMPYIAGGQVFAIVVLRSFISGLPEDIFEAARIDGAGELQTFWNVVIPLSRPIISTMAIVNLLAVWNDYTWPLIVISDDAKRTLTIGLAFLRGVNATDYGVLTSGYIIASLPLLVLFVFFMKQFVSGLMSGALKA